MNNDNGAGERKKGLMNREFWGVILVLGLWCGWSGAALALDVYVDANDNEYAPGYQPPGSFLVHKSDALVNQRPVESKQTGSSSPAFRTSAAVRSAYPTGFEIGVEGGIDAFQSGDEKLTLTNTSHNGSQVTSVQTAKGAQSNEAGLFTAIDLAYTWRGFDGKAVVDGSRFELLPSVQLDGFYLGRNVSTSGTAYGDSFVTRSNESVYGFTGDFVLRAQAGAFRPYVGAGAGVAHIRMSNPEIVDQKGSFGQAFYTDSESGASPVFTAFAGLDCFVTRNVSIFGEYRYLGIVGTDFDSHGVGLTNAELESGLLSEHVFSLGARYHF